MIDVADCPYPEFNAMTRVVGEQMYAIRSARDAKHLERVEALSLSASTDTLSVPGVSTQTSAIATIIDGVTLPVDGAANGTSYIISNPAVCTVTVPRPSQRSSRFCERWMSCIRA